MKVFRSLLPLAFICAFFAPPLLAQQTPPSTTPQPAAAPPRADVTNGTITVRREYLLGPNDVVELRVFGEPQLDGSFVIDPDGNLEIPFAEEPIRAQCRSVKELRADIVNMLSKFLKKPQVYLTIKEQRSRTPATVYGAVRSPQRYEMQRSARLLELLSQSGGVTEQQSGTVQIFHTQPVLCPEQEEMKVATQARTGDDALTPPFDVYRVEDLRMGKSEANPYIHPGDVIYVAEAAPIYITGNVVQPANLYLKDGMTLSRALAIVGGPKNAKEDKVRIYRQKPGAMKQEVVTVDYKAIKQGKKEDVILQPYDIIEVPEQGKFSPSAIGKLLTGFATGGASAVLTQAPLRILY